MIYKFIKKNSFHQTIPGYLLLLQEELEDNLSNQPYSSGLTNSKLSKFERMIMEDINTRTRDFNLNNVTRTQAYLDFYLRNPEIHWAFLGHMVSRNGGWNMTDLKGEFLSRLLTEREQQDFFLFLERGNWLIFQDVFPQLLLYEKSRQLERPLFHLLPCLSVSVFMKTVWDFFWRWGDRPLLAVSLIINEQSYLEEKLLKDGHYTNVLHTIEFSLQDVLSLNHILFPFARNGKTKLMGQTLHQFTSLHERIELGKRMYTLLFSDATKYADFLQWATDHPHTGSRSDYWSNLFKKVKETIPGRLYNPQIKDCNLKQGASHLYSPPLQFAWGDIKHNGPSQGDWCKDSKTINHLINIPDRVNGEIQHAYCKSLEKLAFTIFTKKAIFLRKG
ncbi:DUF2515 family protein [Pseudalkalibacillus salsuginis]|uniref:DUF2515 family protein n=1 Tax=Pseudalkalibacillus salsuginis TaxID=2910972 RepID=UPI001F30B979|nr:DUF2515 family protein [Pseudalkalibacillus salsuginis]MCF6411695.1 DUF2515 domain-containing protein [Pseudalkalibacillus salsuginis]